MAVLRERLQVDVSAAVALPGRHQLAVDWIAAIGDGLAHAHENGVNHRDVKPSNFLYLTTAPGSPLKAVDFGLAIFFNPAAVATYEAERARGTPASELGPAPLSLGDVGLDGSPWYQGMDISTFA